MTHSIQIVQSAISALTLAPQKDVLLYAGKEAGPNCLKTIRIALKMHLGDCVRDVDANYFKRTDWIANTKLIVIPGGLSTLAFNRALGPVGLENIRQAVCKHTVAYLGICAGANITCQTMSFKNTNFPLPDTPVFFPGNAETPVAQANTDETHQVRALALLIAGKLYVRNCPYASGPYFERADNIHDITVLARYTPNPTQPLDPGRAAIVHCTQNGINALLCGPHPELAIANTLLKSNEVAEVDVAFSYVVWHKMLWQLGMVEEEEITPLPEPFKTPKPAKYNPHALIYDYLFAPAQNSLNIFHN